MRSYTVYTHASLTIVRMPRFCARARESCYFDDPFHWFWCWCCLVLNFYNKDTWDDVLIKSLHLLIYYLQQLIRQPLWNDYTTVYLHLSIINVRMVHNLFTVHVVILFWICCGSSSSCTAPSLACRFVIISLWDNSNFSPATATFASGDFRVEGTIPWGV